MQGRQWDLAHDEEDHLGALISGQGAGKGACRKKMVGRVGPGQACAAGVSQLSLSAEQTTAVVRAPAPRDNEDPEGEA